MDSLSGTEGWSSQRVKPFNDPPIVDSPALSQISCLSSASENKGNDEPNSPKSNLHDNESAFVRLCKEGGHKGLLQIEEPSKSSGPVAYERKGGDWFYQDDNVDNGSSGTRCSNIRDTDSEFVRLSKQGGHEGLLRIDSGNNENPFVNSSGRYVRKQHRVSPSSCRPAGMQPTKNDVAPGNPIWLGGSGPEMGFVPGKRFMKKDLKESPFALSDDWKGAQTRNPDKI